jgi:hypothetical protein
MSAVQAIVGRQGSDLVSPSGGETALASRATATPRSRTERVLKSFEVNDISFFLEA